MTLAILVAFSDDVGGPIAERISLGGRLSSASWRRSIYHELTRKRPMRTVADYSAFEALHDGREVEIRAQRPSDREGWLAAFRRASAETLHRRFLAAAHEPTEEEIEHFFDVDFVDHVALLAVTRENGASRIVGVCRYVVTKPGQAEVAFTVTDDFQHDGLGALMMRHLSEIARKAGVRELVADVLADNVAMLKVFRHSGLAMTTTMEDSIVRVVLCFPAPGNDAGEAHGDR